MHPQSTTLDPILLPCGHYVTREAQARPCPRCKDSDYHGPDVHLCLDATVYALAPCGACDAADQLAARGAPPMAGGSDEATTYRTRHWTLKLHGAQALTAISRIWCAICDRCDERGTVYQNVDVTESSSAHVSVCLDCWERIAPTAPTSALCAHCHRIIVAEEGDTCASIPAWQRGAFTYCAPPAPAGAPAYCVRCKATWTRLTGQYTDYCPGCRDSMLENTKRCNEYAAAQLAARGAPPMAGGSEDWSRSTTYTLAELNSEARHAVSYANRAGTLCALCNGRWLYAKTTWALIIPRAGCPSLRITMACREGHTTQTGTAI